MRDDITRQSVLFGELFDRPVVARFDQPQSSSDGGAVLLTPDGGVASPAGSTIGVTGSATNESSVCAGQKLFAATAIVYYTFGPVN